MIYLLMQGQTGQGRGSNSLHTVLKLCLADIRGVLAAVYYCEQPRSSIRSTYERRGIIIIDDIDIPFRQLCHWAKTTFNLSTYTPSFSNFNCNRHPVLALFILQQSSHNGKRRSTTPIKSDGRGHWISQWRISLQPSVSLHECQRRPSRYCSKNLRGDPGWQT